MLVKSNDSDLTEKKIDSRYHLFYQLWNELLDFGTYTKYKYKSANILSCLKELRSVIEHKQNDPSAHDTNIKLCSEEAIELVKSDAVIQKYYREISNRLLHELGKKCDTDFLRNRRLYVVEYSISVIEPSYMKHLLDEIENEFAETDSSGTKNIIRYTQLLVSYCISIGWSERALYDSINILHNSVNDRTLWPHFKGHITESRKEYKVYFPVYIGSRAVNDDGQKIFPDDMSYMNIKIRKGDEIRNELSDVVAKDKLSNTMYMEIEALSFDPYSASLQSLRKISDLLNFLSFYNQIEPWNIRDVSWVVFDVSKRQLKLIKSSEIFEIHNNSPLYREHIIYRQSEGTVSTLIERFAPVFSYANLGKISYSFEEQFLNFWVALEAFCRSDVSESIIQNIIDIVSSAMCINYVHKVFLNFIRDCARCKVDTADFFGNTSSEDIQVQKLIEIFRDSALYSELETRCSVNKLLLHRCKELRTTASAGSNMADEAKAYHTEVARNIGRMYRVRNNIAHNARNAAGIHVMLTKQLEYYLQIVLSVTVEYSSHHEGRDIKCLFEMIKDNYVEFEKCPANSPTSCMKDFMRSGRIKFVY